MKIEFHFKFLGKLECDFRFVRVPKTKKVTVQYITEQ